MSVTVLLTRETLLAQLRKLREGPQGRERVASWARHWLHSDEAIGDPLLLKTMVYLAAADLPGPARPYLYGESDFEAWQTQLHGTPQ